jgi:molecular chaperone DnaK
VTGPDAKPLALRIRLPFATEEEFIERYGQNVARGGIFIATRAVKSLGTALAFELVLQNGERLMRGEGAVQQVQEDEAPGKSGMLVRFIRLDARSKALIDKVLAFREGLGDAQIPASPPSAPLPPEAPPAKVFKPAAARLADDVVLGIDLGTTTCRAAVWLDGAPQLIPLAGSTAFALPSLVALDEKGKMRVGLAAKTLRADHPEAAVTGLKRLLGQRARSKAVQQLQPRFPFKVVADPDGDAGAELGDRVWSLPELAALLLAEIKSSAQQMLERELKRAVLCVPAWYSDHQRAAVLEAGRLAGLEVLRILNEPSAVALAFGYGRGLARKRLLVYDLGGGTFDASVVEMTGDDLEVVSTGGDNFLGGIDFDERVADALAGTLPENQRERLEQSRVGWERVRDAAEIAKIALSDQESAAVHVPSAVSDEGGAPVDLRATVSRAQIDQLTADLVERTAEVTRVVLEVGRVSAGALDEVLLVGGQSRAPLVRKRLEELLGRPPRTDVDPQGAVALGAAIFGHSLVQRERGKAGLSLSEVLSAPIGVAVKGGGFLRVLERNTRLPAEKTLSVPIADQPIEVAVFQGTNPRADENEYLGALHASAEKPGEILLRFAVSADGRLDVGPVGRKGAASFSTADASDEMRARLFAQAPLPGEDDPERKGLFTGLKRLFGR